MASKRIQKRKQVNRHSNATKARIGYLMAASGNVSQVARDVNHVPCRATIQSWVRDDAVYHEALIKAQQEISDELLAQHLKSAQLSGAQLQDRIVNGDTKVLANGNTVSVPMTGRDLAVVNGIQTDKARVSMGLATSRTDSSSASMDDMVTMFNAISESYDKRRRIVSEQ